MEFTHFDDKGNAVMVDVSDKDITERIATAEGTIKLSEEALTGVSVALLTIYDMCKAIDKRMVLGDIHLVEKSGGKSGEFKF